MSENNQRTGGNNSGGSGGGGGSSSSTSIKDTALILCAGITMACVMGTCAYVIYNQRTRDKAKRVRQL